MLMPTSYPGRMAAPEIESIVCFFIKSGCSLEFILLYYAKSCTWLLWIFGSIIALMFYLLIQKRTRLSSLLSLISMEFFKVCRNSLHSTVYPLWNWHRILKYYWCPGCFLPFSFKLIRKCRGWPEFALNTVDRHLCWNTFKEDSLENVFYWTRGLVFLAFEIISIWKSELFLIFDQLFCEASTSIFMHSICDIIQLFPWQRKYSRKTQYKM